MGSWSRAIREALQGFLNADGTAIKTETNLVINDLEVGAVEIKNATDDTRATVGLNGLYVDVQNTKAHTALLQGNTTLSGSAQQLH